MRSQRGVSPHGLSLARAADIAGCSPGTLFNQIAKGALTCTGQRTGGLILDSNSFYEWLDRRPPFYEDLANQGELLTLMDMVKITGFERTTLNNAIQRGELEATKCYRRETGGQPFFVAFRTNFEVWLHERASRLETGQAILGEHVTCLEAANHWNVSAALLLKAVAAGLLPGRRVHARNGGKYQVVVGRLDVDRWMSSRLAPRPNVGMDLLTQLTGMYLKKLRVMLRDAGLRPISAHNARGSRVVEFSPGDVASWLEQLAPYCPEVTALPSCLSSREVACELQMDESVVVKAMTDGQLPAFLRPGTDPRFMTSRFAMDAWRRTQGLPVDYAGTQSEWCSIHRARELTGLSKGMIYRRIKDGSLATTQIGGAFAVAVDSLRLLRPGRARSGLAPINQGDRLTVPQAARQVGCGVAAVRRAIRLGSLPASCERLPWLVEARDLERWHNESQGYLNLSEVKRRHGVSHKRLARAINCRELATTRKGRLQLIKFEDLERWLEAQAGIRDLLTVDDVANRFSISVSRVRGALNCGHLALALRTGGHPGLYVRLEEAQRWYQERCCPLEPLLDTAQAARQLGVSRQVVLKRIRLGQIPAVKRNNPENGKSAWGIRPSDLPP